MPRTANKACRDSDFVTVYNGHAKFTGPRQLQVILADETVDIGADRIVIAAGSRPVVPHVVADSGLPFETSDTVMHVAAPPEHLVILGGG